jgi:peptidoglycan/LPS O-acetylase OafA/YrhL
VAEEQALGGTLTEPPSRPSERFEGVQALRFVAALLVVATHSTLYANERLTSSIGIWDGGTIGVDIFFIISGFVMVVSSTKIAGLPGAAKEFFGRRLVRIVPMYWLATTLKVVALIAIPTAVLHSELDWTRIAASYLFLPTISPDGVAEPLLGVGWTLIFEMFFYVLFAVALAVKRDVFAVCVPVLVAFALLNILRPDDWSVWWYYFNPIVLYFAVGMYLGRYVLSGSWRGPALGIAGCLALHVVVSITNDNYWMRGGGALRSVIATLAVIAAIELPRRMRRTPPKLLTDLGDASYSLYLFHPLFAPVIPVALFHLGIISPALSVALTLVAMPVMSLVIYRLAERPTTGYLRRWVPGATRRP